MEKEQGTENETEKTNEDIKPETEKINYNTLLIAASIVVAGTLIGAGIVLGSYLKKTPTPIGGTLAQQPQGDPESITPVSADEHIRGSANAKVVLVEFSDLDCPFCKNVHETFKQILQEYGSDVAWVYRHFPIPQLHPSAQAKAEISECIANEYSNDAFWDFTDLYFQNQSATDGAEYALTIAKQLNLDSLKIQDCLDKQEFQGKVSEQIDEAIKAGANGTPYTILVSGDDFVPITGAQPIANFKSAIDSLLNKK